MTTFNKKAFSDILQRVYNLYPNQREFAEIADINRTYISKYINQRMDVPPSAHILKRLARASKGLTTYEELMVICGYIENNRRYIKISTNDLKILDEVIQEYARRKIELLGIKDFFPEVIHDIDKKLNALISISRKIMEEVN